MSDERFKPGGPDARHPDARHPDAPPRAPDQGAPPQTEGERREDAASGRRIRDPGEGQRREERVRQAIRTEVGDSEENADNGRPIIELENVTLSFDRPILEDISFQVFEGQTVVVVGESGTGKSTALKLILRLLVPESGRVLIEGQDVGPLSFVDALKVRQTMGMVFQGAALFDSMTVFENIAYPLREHTELTDDEIMDRVREKLEFVDLNPDDVMSKLPAELSGGMKKRVGIARGMANNPRIMLYDEPTSGLDPLTTGTITRLIVKLQRELNVTSVVVSHDIRSAFRMASAIALLSERRIVFYGSPEEMAGSEDPYIRDFLGGF